MTHYALCTPHSTKGGTHIVYLYVLCIVVLTYTAYPSDCMVSDLI